MKKWITLVAVTLVAAGSYGAALEDWQLNDPSGTFLPALTNSGTVGSSWDFGGLRVQDGKLNVGDTQYYKFDPGVGQTFRTASFPELTTGNYVFEFVIADWDLAGSDGLGVPNNGIKFGFGHTTNGSVELEFEVAQSPSNDIRVRSQNSSNGNLTGTDVQDQLGALDLTNTASVTVQLIADLDTGEWSTQVDYGTGFVNLVTNGTGMTMLDRIQLIVDASNGIWEYGGVEATATEFVLIDSITLSEPGAAGPWTQLEYFDFESDAAGLGFNWFANSGSLNSLWDFGGGDPAIATDGAGSLVISNHLGAFYRQLPQAGTANATNANQYASPFASGKYRFEVDLDSWDLDTNSIGSKIAIQLNPAAASVNSGEITAAMNLIVQDASTFRVQLFYDSAVAGNQNNFRNFDYSLTNSTPHTFAIELDYDAETVEYFVDGLPIATSYEALNTNSPIGTLQFYTENWSTNSVLAIDAIGFSEYNASAAPVLAVDFSSSQIASGIQIEHFDVPLNLLTPATFPPNYTGQPIYCGLELDPVSGKITGIDDGGTYTNGAAISFGSNGAKLQWNGPFPGNPGDDAGRYEEDDVATGLFLFQKEDFLNGLDTNTVAMADTNDTLSATVSLDTGVNHGTYGGVDRLKSGQFRWVIRDAGSYYISDEAVNLTSDSTAAVTAEALDVNWFSYDPVTSITNVSGAAASPTLQDIDLIGFWMSATVNTNDGNRTYPHIGCSSFEAAAVAGTFVAGPFDITSIQLISGNTQVQLVLNGLVVDQDYKIQDSVDLTAGFSDVAGSQFTATDDTAQSVVVPADTATQPERFFQATVAP